MRLIGLHEFPARGHRLRFVGPVTLDGTAFLRLDAAYDDGYAAEFYLDPDGKLVRRMREHKPMHLDVDPTRLRIETPRRSPPSR